MDYADDVAAGQSANSGAGCSSRCLQHHVTQRILKFLFSNIGLCIIVILYTVLGALLFQAIELPDEKHKANKTRYHAMNIEVLAHPQSAIILN